MTTAEGAPAVGQTNVATLSVGDKVTYYCNTDMTLREGVITAVDVPVEWLWHWPEHGTVMQSPHRTPGATHPLGVQINGSLTRAYYGAGRGTVDDYDKSKVQA